MAEEKKQSKPQEKTKEVKQPEKKESKRPVVQENYETLVRVFGYDLPGSKNIFSALTRIKGVSWTISNAVCLKLGFPRSKKVSELTKADIQKIEEFLPVIPIPDFLKNRRFDPETGRSSHLYSTNLDIAKEFDIKRLKKMKSYKGVRHTSKLPVRGQRTRSHFRSKSQAAGMKKIKVPKAATAPVGGKK